MKEIESKAWVFENDKARVLNFLKIHTKILQSAKIKQDTMYSKADSSNNSKKPLVEFRLRTENSDTNNMLYSVTRKTRSYTDLGTEVNNELEFFVSNSQEFHDFALQLGYDVFYRKEKKVQQFTINADGYDILLEYVEISGLSKKGDLLEIEIVCDDSTTEKEVLVFEKEIIDIFKKLDLENQIESAPYGKLLKMC